MHFPFKDPNRTTQLPVGCLFKFNNPISEGNPLPGSHAKPVICGTYLVKQIRRSVCPTGHVPDYYNQVYCFVKCTKRGKQIGTYVHVWATHHLDDMLKTGGLTVL